MCLQIAQDTLSLSSRRGNFGWKMKWERNESYIMKEMCVALGHTGGGSKLVSNGDTERGVLLP